MGGERQDRDPDSGHRGGRNGEQVLACSVLVLRDTLKRTRGPLIGKVEASAIELWVQRRMLVPSTSATKHAARGMVCKQLRCSAR